MANPKNNEKLTAEETIAALKETRGMITYAARRLGVAYNTIRRMIDTYPTVKAAYDEFQEQIADDIELTSLSMALGKKSADGKSWEQEPNVTLLIFLSKTHPALRKRGYAERQEVTGAGGGAIEYKLIYPESPKKRINDDSDTNPTD